jgi:hypothetical protein
VNTKSDNAQVWAIDEPAATDPTPNETPNTPTAMLNVLQATIIGRSDGSRHQRASASTVDEGMAPG